MKMITLRNDLHNTECQLNHLHVVGLRIDRMDVLRCRRELCGVNVSDCACGGVLKNRGARSIVDDEGREYCVARLGKDPHGNPYVQLELVDEPAV